ncbi:MFS transporter [Mesorhizobium sp. M0208]|uniref:MFS transporter n=1 Tax=Mesorhizobium sp. M0208 TaxID=2956916 RepID=UPI003336739C
MGHSRCVLCIGDQLLLSGMERARWAELSHLMPAGAAWIQSFSLFKVTVQLSAPRWVVGRALSLSDGHIRRHGGGKLALGRTGGCPRCFGSLARPPAGSCHWGTDGHPSASAGF